MSRLVVGLVEDCFVDRLQRDGASGDVELEPLQVVAEPRQHVAERAPIVGCPLRDRDLVPLCGDVLQTVQHLVAVRGHREPRLAPVVGVGLAGDEPDLEEPVGGAADGGLVELEVLGQTLEREGTGVGDGPEGSRLGRGHQPLGGAGHAPTHRVAGGEARRRR